MTNYNRQNLMRHRGLLSRGNSAHGPVGNENGAWGCAEAVSTAATLVIAVAVVSAEVVDELQLALFGCGYGIGHLMERTAAVNVSMGLIV